MSDVGLLSQEYRTAAAFAHAVNQSLIILKKHQLDALRQSPIAGQGHTAEALELGQLLQHVASAIEGNAAGSSALETPRVPATVISELRSLHKGRIPYLVDDLRKIADALAESRWPTDEEFGVLDQIAATADAQRSALFRRMMRR